MALFPSGVPINQYDMDASLPESANLPLINKTKAIGTLGTETK